MAQILDKAGVGIDHFKIYVAVSMSWPRVVNARFGSSGGRMSNEELVRRMQENDGKKPVTTEYFLQQVIFVVPAAKRNAIIGKRQAEANASRAKFPGCEQAKVFAATMRDVSIRNLGRMMAQELPEDWKPLIEKAGDGNTTGRVVTERGVEYLAICKKRQVSDDVAAKSSSAPKISARRADGEDPNNKKYIDELRQGADPRIADRSRCPHARPAARPDARAIRPVSASTSASPPGFAAASLAVPPFLFHR